MADRLNVAIAQLNPVVGDVAGNLEKLRAARQQAAAAGADIIITPELFLTGYSPEDMVLRADVQAACARAIDCLMQDTADGGPAVLVGTPWTGDGTNGTRGHLYNALVLLDGGGTHAVYRKQKLINTGVFNEKRVFAGAGPQPPVTWRGIKIALGVCEDAWHAGPLESQIGAGAEIAFVANASPYSTARIKDRMAALAAHQANTANARHVPIIYCNQVGGQDGVVYDGQSMVFQPGSDPYLLAPWEETVGVETLVRGQARDMMGFGLETFAGYRQRAAMRNRPDAHLFVRGDDDLAMDYMALVTGLRDYVHKNGFDSVVLGMSGGIDSAISAAIAVDALGCENVECVMMRSPFTSQASIDLAQEAVRALGCKQDDLDIGPAMRAMEAMFGHRWAGLADDVAEENFQARIRGMALMGISNKAAAEQGRNVMVLATGNKSEMAVGYSTLYGDMCGGYALIRDVYKTRVFALSDWRNHHWLHGMAGPQGQVIPQGIIDRKPTAELAAGQSDEAALGSYPDLDEVLQGYIEDDMDVTGIVAASGLDEAYVSRIVAMVDRSEYKRRQGPPGTRITRRALVDDRNYPITNAMLRGLDIPGTCQP